MWRGSRERGAAAVEFALVLPLLLLLVLGGIDYGIYFSDSMALRDAARTGARTAALDPTVDLAAVEDAVREDAAGATGEADVSVEVRSDADLGQVVVVCAELTDRAEIGLVPLPDGGTIRTRVVFAVEQPRDVVPVGQPLGTWCD
jgi:Flp pilus assembly protein TadG